MKKLYVLVFLIMFMGKIFSSQAETRIIDANLNGQIVKFDVIFPKNTVIHAGGQIDHTIITAISRKLKAWIDKNKPDFESLFQSFKDYKIMYSSPVINIKEIGTNPWDTLAPRVFAKEFGLKESDLKPSLFRNLGKTPEQKFILNLQKALIEKISGIKSVKSVTNIMEPLRALLLANSKIPDGPDKKSITEIFNSINSDIKTAVIQEIMKNLAAVNLDINGNVIKKQNTLAELVLERIRDSYYRKALVEIALRAQAGDFEMLKVFFKGLIDNPQKSFKLEEEIIYPTVKGLVSVKLSEVAPITIGKAKEEAKDLRDLTDKMKETYEAQEQLIRLTEKVKESEISLSALHAAQNDKEKESEISLSASRAALNAKEPSSLSILTAANTALLKLKLEKSRAKAVYKAKNERLIQLDDAQQLRRKAAQRQREDDAQQLRREAAQQLQREADR